MKNAIPKLKNPLDELNSSLQLTEDSENQYRLPETIQSEKQRNIWGGEMNKTSKTRGISKGLIYLQPEPQKERGGVLWNCAPEIYTVL